MNGYPSVVMSLIRKLYASPSFPSTKAYIYPHNLDYIYIYTRKANEIEIRMII